MLELKKNADVEKIKNILYKKTKLEDTFGVNMLAIVDHRPETLGLKQIIAHNVKFQYELAAVRDNIEDSYESYFGSFQDIDQYYGMQGNNWVDRVFGNTGTTFNADLSVSGSGENYQWTLGYAHIDDNAIMSGSSYRRDNLNLKTKFKLHEDVSIDANVRYSRTYVRGGAANGIEDAGTTSGNGRLKHSVCYTPIPISSAIEGIDLEEDYGDNAPPLQSITDNDQQKKRSDFNANAAFNWEIVDNLRLKVEGGYQEYTQTDDRFYGLTIAVR